MVISVGDNFYLALAKGPLDETNILICSVTHVPSTSLLAEDDWKELEKFKDALRKCFKGEFGSENLGQRIAGNVTAIGPESVC